MTISTPLRRMASRTLAALLLSGAAIGAPASAQIARNSDAPLDMTADELEVVNTQCLAIWRGSAEALQADSRLRAAVIRIYSKAGGGGAAGSNCGALDHMEADGDVYYVTPQQRVRSNSAVYDSASDQITMTGDVVAVQGKNVLRGERLTIVVKTGAAQMQTSVRGRNKPGRVRGVFYPNQTQAAQSAPKR